MVHKTNTRGIKPGDVITFTNKVGYKVRLTVERAEKVSWYTREGGEMRKSYGTLDQWAKNPDFKIN
jgi:hypothetical protein